MLPSVSTLKVRSADGTTVQAWCNDGGGTPVLLCNGLGPPPAAWPRIIARDSGYRVVTGVLAVAGVPGGSYDALFGPYRVPRRFRTRIGHLSSRLLPVVGPLLPLVVASVPPWSDLLSPS